MDQMITVTAKDGHVMDAYRADPDGTPKGGIVVPHEIFGVNEFVKECCDNFAKAGYAAVAPSVFDRSKRGVVVASKGGDPAIGMAVRKNLTDDGLLADMDAAAEVLRPLGKIGVSGMCFGGYMTWIAATNLELDCAVGFYGGNTVSKKDNTLNCPTMFHFGEKDQSIPLDQVEAIQAAHPEMPIHIYDGCGHGFCNNMRDNYNAEAAKLSWNRTIAFFDEHLAPAQRAAQ